MPYRPPQSPTVRHHEIPDYHTSPDERVSSVFRPTEPQFTAVSQIRLIGERSALQLQVDALKQAGFTLASEHIRKTRDVNSTEIIYTATLIN